MRRVYDKLGSRRNASMMRAFFDFVNPQPQLHVHELPLFKAFESRSSGDVNQAGHISKWNCVNDNDYGGKSFSNVTDHIDEESGEQFIRVTGNVLYDDELAKNNKVKGGFCAILGNCAPIVDLRDYEGLQMTMRSRRKHQSFTINLKSSSLFEDDLYQIRCELKGGGKEWKKINVPFSMFHLTARGMARDYNRANDSLQVESIGFLFKQEDCVNQKLVEGEESIELDIKEITAVENCVASSNR